MEDIWCLTVRQPWAWLIIHGGKDIENRSWPTKIRGRVLIHAAKVCTKSDYDNATYVVRRWISDTLDIPPISKLEKGGIIGSVEIYNCVEVSGSPWFGDYGWAFMLDNPQPLPFVPCKGTLRFWKYGSTGK